MSNNFISDSDAFLSTFGLLDAAKNLRGDNRVAFLKRQVSLIQNKIDKLNDAIDGVENPSGRSYSDSAHIFIDNLIDACFLSLTTLNIMNIDVGHAWDEVYAANMNKTVDGTDDIGMPVLKKNVGWAPPSHTNNFGYLLTRVIDDEFVGTILPRQEFIDNAIAGVYDGVNGVAFYSDGIRITRNRVLKSDVMNGWIQDKFSHVVWILK